MNQKLSSLRKKDFRKEKQDQGGVYFCLFLKPGTLGRNSRQTGLALWGGERPEDWGFLWAVKKKKNEEEGAFYLSAGEKKRHGQPTRGVQGDGRIASG